MLIHSTSQKEHWGTVDKLVESWLKERQEMILLYCAVDSLKEFTPKDTPTEIKVQAFTDILIDYVSAGHFEIYDKLFQEAADFNEDHTDFAHSILTRIQASTQIAVDFHDKYANQNIGNAIIPELAADLSHLGEKLVERFDLEDQLIEMMHNRHRELVA
ncbi:MAG: sigma D regulator [Gammaproteobacteria bacterium]|nr:MAG: sigma D regulator [Gammaproteobacteria bacterium]